MKVTPSKEIWRVSKIQLDRVEQALSYAREKKGALLRTLYKRARSENSCPVGVVTFTSPYLLYFCFRERR